MGSKYSQNTNPFDKALKPPRQKGFICFPYMKFSGYIFTVLLI